MNQELDDELRFHIEQQTEANLKAGMTAQEARYQALKLFGGVEQIKEECRDTRGTEMVMNFFQDVSYGLRMMRRSPGFTATAAIALALGIGANTAIFSVVNAVLLRPLAYKDANHLVVILHSGRNPVAPANFLDWRSQNHVFQSMGAAESSSPNLTGVDKPEQLRGLRLTADVLPMLGVQPLMGRVFLDEEQQTGKDHVAILSYGLWQRRFAADPGVIGQTLTLNGEAHNIVGVMPREFKFAPFWATKTEIWMPLALGNRTAGRGGNSLRVFARLKPGVTLERARAEMATITSGLEKQYPGTNREVTVIPLAEKVVGNIRQALLVLLGAVGFVLLISCANVAHMLLARAAARQKEIAVRTALGARGSRMVRQFLTEGLLLAALGGGLGWLLTMWGIRVLVALSPAQIPRVETVGIDGRVLLFMMAVSIFTGVVFGMAPASQSSDTNLGDALKEGGRGSTEGLRQNRMRDVLVASEFALALVLLVGAGLMVRSFLALQAIDPGFNPRNVLSMVVSVAGSEQADAHRRTAFFQQMVQEVATLPGVDSASAINHLPLAGDIWGFPFYVEGRPLPRPGFGPGETPVAVYRVVLPGYFRTMNIPLLRGRDIVSADTLAASKVVVVNEKLAQEYWPGEDAVGKRITLDNPQKNPAWVTVVGVVKNARQEQWALDPDPEFYLPFLQSSDYMEGPSPHVAYLTLVVRTARDNAALAPAVSQAIWSIDKNVTISQIETMEEAVAESNAQPRFYLLLLATFAGVALVLAAVGIYGVMSYSVSRRTHEIGVRMALGASRAKVLRLVVGHGMMVALLGAVVGLMGALGLARSMSTLLYGVRPTDPPTFVAVSLVLGAAALFASYIPARRATKVDPMVALRHE
jgi:predicted permease